jgi:hypothetical protein
MVSSSHASKRSHLSFQDAKKALLAERVIKRTCAENHGSTKDSDFEYIKKTTSRWTLPPCTPRKEYMELNLEDDTSFVYFYSFQLSTSISNFF